LDRLELQIIETRQEIEKARLSQQERVMQQQVCSVLQGVADCCSMLQCVGALGNGEGLSGCVSARDAAAGVVVCCRELQTVAVCCSVLQCVSQLSEGECVMQ